MKSRKPIPILLLIFAIIASGVVAKDVIYTKEGDEIDGKLEKIEGNQVTVRVEGELTTYNIDELHRIELGKDRPGNNWNNVEDVQDSLLLHFWKNQPQNRDFPGAGYITLHEKHEVSMALDGTVEHSVRRIILLCSERSKDEVSLSVNRYFPDYSFVDVVFARTISPDGSILHLDDSAIERGPMNTFIPKYDRVWQFKYALGKLMENSIIDIKEQQIWKYKTSLDPIYIEIPFQSTEPALHRELELTVQAGTPFHFLEFNWPENWPEPEVVDSGQNTIYTWSIDNIQSIIEEGSMPPTNTYQPYIAMTIGTGWEQMTLDFTEELDALANKDKIDPQLLNGIIGNSSTDEEKALAIYSWILENIRLIDIPPGEFGYHPHDIKEILDDNFANNLDRCALFYALANAADLDVDIALVSTHEIGFDKRIPSPATTPIPLILMNKPQKKWISLSQNNFPMGSFELEIAGEEAIIISRGIPVFDKLEIPDLQTEYTKNEISAKLKRNGTLKGTITSTYYGTHQDEWRDYRYALKEEISRDMQNKVKEIHPRAVMDDFEITGIESMDEIPVCELEFHIDDYTIIAGDKFIAFNLPGIDYSSWGTGSQSRHWPIWFGYPYRQTNSIEIELPSKYEVHYLPEDTSSSADSILYSASFDIEDNVFIFEDDYSRSRLAFPPKMYPDYKDYRFLQAAISSKWIVLQKK